MSNEVAVSRLDYEELMKNPLFGRIKQQIDLSYLVARQTRDDMNCSRDMERFFLGRMKAFEEVLTILEATKQRLVKEGTVNV